MRVLNEKVDAIVRAARDRADRDPEFREALLGDPVEMLAAVANLSTGEFALLRFVEEGVVPKLLPRQIQVELPPASFFCSIGEDELELMLQARRAELQLNTKEKSTT